MIRLGALHLHHRRGRRLEAAEVGEQVGLAGCAQLLEALVAAGLGEDVDGVGIIPPVSALVVAIACGPSVRCA